MNLISGSLDLQLVHEFGLRFELFNILDVVPLQQSGPSTVYSWEKPFFKWVIFQHTTDLSELDGENTSPIQFRCWPTISISGVAF